MTCEGALWSLHSRLCFAGPSAWIALTLVACTPVYPQERVSLSSGVAKVPPAVSLRIQRPPFPTPFESAEEREREVQLLKDRARREGGLARFNPVSTVDVRGPWLEYPVELGARGMAQVAELDGRWLKGDPRIPEEVLSLPGLNAISPAGAHPLGDFVWVERGDFANSLHVGFRAGPVRAPALVSPHVPAEGLVVRLAPKRKRVGRRHPMVLQWRRSISSELRTELAHAERQRNVRFEVQSVPGSFPTADRIVVVFVGNLIGDEYDAGMSAMFSVNANHEIVHRLGGGSSLQIVMVFDLDGDGFDEFYTEDDGYEVASYDIRRLTPSGEERINTYEWAE